MLLQLVPCEMAIFPLQLPGRARGFLALPWPASAAPQWLWDRRGKPHAPAAPPDWPTASPRLPGVTLPIAAASPSLVLDTYIRNARQSRCIPGRGERAASPSQLGWSSAPLLSGGSGWHFGASQMAARLCPGETEAASRRCWKEQHKQVAG